jgi:hypothetical protein
MQYNMYSRLLHVWTYNVYFAYDWFGLSLAIEACLPYNVIVKHYGEIGVYDLQCIRISIE